MSVDAILQKVEELTPGQQTELFQRLQERFREPDHGLSDAQMEELKRRIAAADADPSAGIPWEVVKAESLKRSRK